MYGNPDIVHEGHPDLHAQPGKVRCMNVTGSTGATYMAKPSGRTALAIVWPQAAAILLVLVLWEPLTYKED